jgi:hypothetical protein
MENLEQLINNTISKIKEHGINPEDNQLELKQEWPNLKDANSTTKNINISKFLRSLTALSNTYGPGNKYLIYGITENGEILNAPLKNSGIADPAHLYDLIARNVDKPITYDFKEIIFKQSNKKVTLSIFIIPPSYTKPHVIENYYTDKNHFKNYIPVKKGTKTVEAGKDDLDLMYYDRGNVIPEYSLNIVWFNKSIAVGENSGSFKIPTTLIFENNGRRPLIFKSCEMHLVSRYKSKWESNYFK